MSKRCYRICLVFVMTIAILVLAVVCWQRENHTISKKNSLFVENDLQQGGGRPCHRKLSI